MKIPSWVWVLIFVLFLSSCRRYNHSEASSEIYIKTDSLLNLAHNLDSFANNYKVEAKLFVDLFPKDYKSFIALYGFDENNNKPSPLYNDYEKHVKLFCEDSTVSISDKAKRFIQLGLNGKWDADAVNMLQSCARDFTISNSELIVHILNTNFPKDSSYWYFLLDSPHPGDNEIVSFVDSLRKKIMTIDKEQANIISKQFEIIKHEAEDNH